MHWKSRQQGRQNFSTVYLIWFFHGHATYGAHTAPEKNKTHNGIVLNLPVDQGGRVSNGPKWTSNYSATYSEWYNKELNDKLFGGFPWFNFSRCLAFFFFTGDLICTYFPGVTVCILFTLVYLIPTWVQYAFSRIYLVFTPCRARSAGNQRFRYEVIFLEVLKLGTSFLLLVS